MANRSALTATRWIEDSLHCHGWPPVSFPFLAQLRTYIGEHEVEHFDCTVSRTSDYDERGKVAPDSSATIVVFTASHLFVQTVDCHRRAKRFASDVQVLRRSALASITSQAEVEVQVPPLRRLRDWLGTWSSWLAWLVDAAVDRWSWLQQWYDIEEPDGEVVVDLTYPALREPVLTLPLGEDASSMQRLTHFLPSLAADIA